jgi:methylated-DNA-[protein]-cysteine S-methyltransferase
MPLSTFQARMATPVCTLGIRTFGGVLAEIRFLPHAQRELAPADALAEETCRQIARYLADPAFRFELPLAELGTPFQRRVWAGIAAIPRGETRTYGDIAAALASAPRAVGQACGANAFPLVIPCHRVVSAAGLGGFAHHDRGFHLSVKRWLLAHEGAE